MTLVTLLDEVIRAIGADVLDAELIEQAVRRAVDLLAARKAAAERSIDKEVSTMNKRLPVLILPLLLAGAAAQQESPAKGDKTYIAATFPQAVRYSTGKYEALMDIKPCAELVVQEAEPQKLRWVVQEPNWASITRQSAVRLEGPWLPTMHKNGADCTARFKEDGEPAVKRSGNTFKITPALPK